MSTYKFTSGQVAMLVSGILAELAKDNNKVFISYETDYGNKVRLLIHADKALQYSTRQQDQWYSIREAAENKVRITIGNVSGEYEISNNLIFNRDKDKEIKELLKIAKNYMETKEELEVTKKIHKCFPNLVAEEFEKEVLTGSKRS